MRDVSCERRRRVVCGPSEIVLARPDRLGGGTKRCDTAVAEGKEREGTVDMMQVNPYVRGGNASASAPGADGSP